MACGGINSCSSGGYCNACKVIGGKDYGNFEGACCQWRSTDSANAGDWHASDPRECKIITALKDWSVQHSVTAAYLNQDFGGFLNKPQGHRSCVAVPKWVRSYEQSCLSKCSNTLGLCNQCPNHPTNTNLFGACCKKGDNSATRPYECGLVQGGFSFADRLKDTAYGNTFFVEECVYVQTTTTTTTPAPVHCVGRWDPAEDIATLKTQCTSGSILIREYQVTTPSQHGGNACPAADGDEYEITCPTDCVGEWSKTRHQLKAQCTGNGETFTRTYTRLTEAAPGSERTLPDGTPTTWGTAGQACAHAQKETDSITCAEYQCTCTHGTPLTGSECGQEGQTPGCVEDGCHAGHHPEPIGAGKFECVVNQCTCSVPGGTAATGVDCDENGSTEKCTDCSDLDVYYNDGGICREHECSCTHGTAASGAGCALVNGNKVEMCTECTAQGYYLNSATKLCEEKQCTCEGGTPATGPECPNHDDQKCTVCNDAGLRLTEDGECLQNSCNCAQGTAAVGAHCTSNNGHICASCEHDGLRLEVDGDSTFCKQNVCTCNNGTKAEGVDCTMHNAEICVSCEHDGLRLEVDGEFTFCRQNVCTCNNGTQAQGVDCTEHNAEICASCDHDWLHVDKSEHCVQNVCTCANGEEVSGEACKQHGLENCASCDANAGFAPFTVVDTRGEQEDSDTEVVEDAGAANTTTMEAVHQVICWPTCAMLKNQCSSTGGDLVPEGAMIVPDERQNTFCTDPATALQLSSPDETGSSSSFVLRLEKYVPGIPECEAACCVEASTTSTTTTTTMAPANATSIDDLRDIIAVAANCELAVALLRGFLQPFVAAETITQSAMDTLVADLLAACQQGGGDNSTAMDHVLDEVDDVISTVTGGGAEAQQPKEIVFKDDETTSTEEPQGAGAETLEDTSKEETAGVDMVCIILLAGAALLLLLLCLVIFCCFCRGAKDDEKEPGNELSQKLLRDSAAGAAAPGAEEGVSVVVKNSDGHTPVDFARSVVLKGFLSAGLSRAYAEKLAQQVEDESVEDDELLLTPTDPSDLQILRKLGMDFDDSDPERVGRMREFLNNVHQKQHEDRIHELQAEARNTAAEAAIAAEDHDDLVEAKMRLIENGYSPHLAGYLAAKLLEKLAEKRDKTDPDHKGPLIRKSAGNVKITLEDLQEWDWEGHAEPEDRAKVHAMIDAAVESAFEADFQNYHHHYGEDLEQTTLRRSVDELDLHEFDKYFSIMPDKHHYKLTGGSSTLRSGVSATSSRPSQGSADKQQKEPQQQAAGSTTARGASFVDRVSAAIDNSRDTGAAGPLLPPLATGMYEVSGISSAITGGSGKFAQASATRRDSQEGFKPKSSAKVVESAQFEAGSRTGTEEEGASGHEGTAPKKKKKVAAKKKKAAAPHGAVKPDEDSESAGSAEKKAKGMRWVKTGKKRTVRVTKSGDEHGSSSNPSSRASSRAKSPKSAAAMKKKVASPAYTTSDSEPHADLPSGIFPAPDGIDSFASPKSLFAELSPAEKLLLESAEHALVATGFVKAHAKHLAKKIAAVPVEAHNQETVGLTKPEQDAVAKGLNGAKATNLEELTEVLVEQKKDFFASHLSARGAELQSRTAVQQQQKEHRSFLFSKITGAPATSNATKILSGAGAGPTSTSSAGVKAKKKVAVKKKVAAQK
ncbi:unnamed protein product [Amoebophrya sp. A120]|nr:unnamed protein product [Amoebophrya sp. A120]|eukprot:GSA120T00013837001.1